MMSITKARYDILARVRALQYDPSTGGQLTVTTRPAPSRLVRMPDPRSSQEVVTSAQEVMTSLCETIHAMQVQQKAMMEELAVLKHGKFGVSGQPATLTVTVRRGASHAPAPTRPHQPAAHPNVRPCPLVQARPNVPDVGYSENNQHTDRICAIVAATGVW